MQPFVVNVRWATSVFAIGLMLMAISAVGQTITQAEYYVDNDPGQGLGTPITVTPGQNVNFSNIHVPTTGLLANWPHHMFTRYLSSEGYWTPGESRVFLIITGFPAPVSLQVTQLEYWWDSDAPTVIDVPDSFTTSWTAFLPSTGLTNGLHKLNVRYVSGENVHGGELSRYMWIMTSQSGTIQFLVVTQLQYWFDSNSPTTVDLTDSSNVSFASFIQTAGLNLGIHTFSIRYQGSEGLWTPVQDRRVLIITPPEPPQPPAYLAGAEYFINVDPGPGNGVQIPFPADSAWDQELEETTLATITGLPTGNHVFYLRFRDDMGHWGHAFGDTISVAPILVIRRVGNDIVLDWQADTSGAPFHIHRNAVPTGTFADIAQTSNTTYTDTGILAGNNKEFYYVTFTRGALANFRLPDLRPAQE
jgi:hypothetical protein